MPDLRVPAELQEPLSSEERESCSPEVPFLRKEIEIPFDSEHKREFLLGLVFQFIGDPNRILCRFDPLGHMDGEALTVRLDMAVPEQEDGTPLQGESVLLVDEISLLAVIDKPEAFLSSLRMEQVVEERMAWMPVIPH